MPRSEAPARAEADPAVSEQRSERSARERILQVAVELIAERGIGGARIAQVARAAGVSTALVHYHFSDRETLLAETLDYAFDVASAVHLRVVGEDNGNGDGSAAKRLADVVEQSLPTTEPSRREWQLWAELWLGAARDASLRPVAAQMYARYRAKLAAAVADGMAAGEFAPVDPGETADLAMALIDGLGLRVLVGDPSMPLEEARERIGQTLARELRIPAGQLPFPTPSPSASSGTVARCGEPSSRPSS